MSATRGMRPRHDDVRVDRRADLPLLGRLNAHGFRLLMAADAVVIVTALVIPMLLRSVFNIRTGSRPLGEYVVGYTLVVVLILLYAKPFGI